MMSGFRYITVFVGPNSKCPDCQKCTLNQKGLTILCISINLTNNLVYVCMSKHVWVGSDVVR